MRRTFKLSKWATRRGCSTWKKHILQVFMGAETTPRPFIYRKGCYRTVPVIARIVKVWLRKCAQQNQPPYTHRPNSALFFWNEHLLNCFSHHFVITYCVSWLLFSLPECRGFSTEDVAVMEPNKFAIRWRIAGTANVPFPGLKIKPYIVPRVCTMILACPMFNMSLTGLPSTVHWENHHLRRMI